MKDTEVLIFPEFLLTVYRIFPEQKLPLIEKGTIKIKIKRSLIFIFQIFTI